jgi:hypothetical protein
MADKQKYHIEVQFNYHGEVFDGDPTDLDELAKLEENGLAEALTEHLNDFFYHGVENVYVNVSAVRTVK